MSKLLVVFGATGQQGGSVIDYVLNDPDLSTQFRIRGITRNTTSAPAEALKKKGVEIVQADPEQTSTLAAAVQGAHTVFSNTVTVYDERLYDREVASGKAIADACVAANVQHLIYSSSTPAGTFTGRAVVAFDCKFEVEQYIRTLSITSAFYSPGTFMQNYTSQQKPRPTGEPGVYAISNIISPTKKLPVIDIVADSGKFIAPLLADPDKYNGKVMYAASQTLTLEEIAAIMSKVSGKTIKYVQYPEDVYKKFLPPTMQEPICAMCSYLDTPGYYGPETDERVAWTNGQVKDKMTTFEQFLTKNPVALD